AIFSLIALFVYIQMADMLLTKAHVIELLKQQGYNKQIFWPLSLYAIIVNPILEELFWRGTILNELDRLKAPFKHFGIVWSSFAYAAFHYSIFAMVMLPGWAEFGTFLLAIYGAALALLYRRTGSIILTAVAHGLLTDTACIVLILKLFQEYPIQ